MAEQKQSDGDKSKEEKPKRTGVLPRAGRAIIHPFDTTKRAARAVHRWAITGNQGATPGTAAMEHDAEDVEKQLGWDKDGKGEGAQKGATPVVTAGEETDSGADVDSFMGWLMDSIGEGAPKISGGVQDVIWNSLEQQEFIIPIVDIPRNKYDEPLTLTSEEKVNTDHKYQADMENIRRALAGKLRAKNVGKPTWDELDIILTTMLYHTATITVKDPETGKEAKELKYRNVFFQTLIDGARMVAPGNEGRVIGNVLNYLATHPTCDKSVEGMEAGKFEGFNMMDSSIPQQFFEKYSYPEREKLANDFYDALQGMHDSKREKYRTILLQEMRNTPQEIELFKNYFEGLQGAEGIAEGGVLAENLKKEHNATLTRVMKAIDNIILDVHDEMTEGRLKGIDASRKALETRLGKDDMKKSIGEGTISELKGLLDLAYELAKKQKEMLDYEDKQLEKIESMKKDEREAVRDKLERMGKKIEGDRKALIKLKSELEQREYPVLTVAYNLIKKNLYDRNGPENIRMDQYVLSPVYYTGGRKGVGKYHRPEKRRENKYLKWFKKWTKRLGVLISPLKWVDEEEKPFKQMNIFEKTEHILTNDWIEKGRLKIRNDKLRKALWLPAFIGRGFHAAAILPLGIAYYLTVWPNYRIFGWAVKHIDSPGQKINEEMDINRHVRKGKEVKAVTTHAVWTATKLTINALIAAAYIAGIAGGIKRGYAGKGFHYAWKGIATVWDNMWSGRIAFYDSLRDKKMKEMKAGMRSEIKLAENGNKNFVSKYFKYQLEENLKSRDHYVSAYYREYESYPYSKMLARSYYGKKGGEKIVDEDVQRLGKIYNKELEGTEKDKAWIKEYVKGEVVTLKKDKSTGDYSMGVNTPAALEKKKQRLGKQLAWLETHPEVVKFLEERNILKNVTRVTNEDLGIPLESAEEKEWHNEGWKGPDPMPVPKRDKEGNIKKDEKGNVKMVQKNVYHRTGYLGDKKDGVKLNTEKTYDFIKELMEAEAEGKKITNAYLSNNLLEYIDKDYLIASTVNQAMKTYRINKLENAKFLINNPQAMDWLKPMFIEGRSAWHVKEGKSDEMIELLVRQADKRGAIVALSLTKIVPGTAMTVKDKVLELADKKEMIEDSSGLFGLNKAGNELKEQLGTHYPMKTDNAFYLIQNEIVKHVKDMGYKVKEGKEKEMVWLTLWELGQQNAKYVDGLANDALFPAASSPSGMENMKRKREEMMSKVIVWAQQKNLLELVAPTYVPEMSVRELILHYNYMGGYNIVEGRADDFITRVTQHLEKGGSTTDFEQPYGAGIPWLVSQGIIEIPQDEVTAAGSESSGVEATSKMVAETVRRLPNLREDLKAYLSVDGVYGRMVEEYGKDRVDFEVDKLITAYINAYYAAKKDYEETGSKDSKKKMELIRREFKKDGIVILTEKMKTEDDARPEDERIYVNLSIGDPVIDKPEKAVQFIVTSKVIKNKFPPKEEEKKEEGKPEKKKKTKKKKKEKKAKKTEEAPPPPAPGFGG
jgi:hypothetical protein